ncbi:4'-phosphopantetheinyl transferase superfamily protein [Pedobacter sp. BMA]|uniref:4'-phosphopantetheinyl transferase family protein n=1 Tax=Pedobacter sp. BMA TaxID=1663685 RepID=UPI00069FF98E|nr:4'-phosphopantetheinyl transferase superfamily protein [Pedobacter sp. BMA]
MHTKEKFVISSTPWHDYLRSSVLEQNLNHVFQINVAECFETIAGQLNAVLPATEIEKASRFSNYDDAQRYLSTRFVLRKLISTTTGQQPSSVYFGEIKNKKPVTKGIAFNISHSANCILITLSKYAIGIDVEYISPRFDYVELISHCFDQDEQYLINSANDKTAMFYALWTRKEAILKATGEGLIDDLPALNCLSPVYRNAGSDFQLQTFALGADYIFTLANSHIAKTIFWNYQI